MPIPGRGGAMRATGCSAGNSRICYDARLPSRPKPLTDLVKRLPFDATSGALLRRLLKDHVRPHLRTIMGALALMGLVAATTALLAKMMEPILDQVFTQRSRADLVWVAAMVLAVFVVKGFATYCQAVLMNRVGLRIVARLQQQLFEHLINADIAYFHSTTTGTLISRLVNDAMLLRSIASNLLTNLGKD